jgi:hypothetical protein
VSDDSLEIGLPIQRWMRIQGVGVGASQLRGDVQNWSWTQKRPSVVVAFWVEMETCQIELGAWPRLVVG